MEQVTLSKKDIKDINSELEKLYGVENFFDKSNKVFLVEDDFLSCDGINAFFYHEDVLVPTLHLLLQNNFLKKVEINMGAVPFIAKGADLMRPGIVGVDPGVEQGTMVAIVDETHNKPVAVGESLFSKEEMETMKVGKMVLNVHHVGDKVWSFK